MTKVQDIVAAKGNEVWSLGPAHSVYQAIEMMALKGVGALTVLSDKGKLIGIISERDYARKVILEGKSSKTTQVAEIMTQEVIFVEPESKVDEAMALMTIKRVRHLPVLLDQQLVGMISVGDLVKSKIDEQSFMIDQLERYIKGETAGVAH
ncbi:MAG: CBS domain-containing protein [Pseudomonadales bacterium]|nr:CBS domain-containing protein [Pseudomonadales bacterium]MDG1306481.1 CBS domain-containing protein [Pseudomonadales bacterium]|tara:strand:+ start:1446 stop:1898 length:453 start_codon:yes stop_codon:yes gene_type:complete